MSTRDELAFAFRKATNGRDKIPMLPDLERRTGSPREYYENEFGLYRGECTRM